MPPPDPCQIDSWEQAEVNAAAWMRWWGFAHARVTPSGADGGVDIRASSALAQVKYEAHQVGRPALQRLVGSRPRSGRQSLLFFTGAGFSEPAVAYADDWDIALFKYALSGSMTPVNRTARHILQAVEEREIAAQEAEEASRRLRAKQAAQYDARLSRSATSGTNDSAYPTPTGSRQPTPSNAERREAELAERREKLLRSGKPLKHRRLGPWMVASVVCVGLGLYALISGIASGTPEWAPAVGLFTVLFIATCFGGDAAVQHNQLVDELTGAKESQAAVDGVAGGRERQPTRRDAAG